jgi:hypothetical protein
LCKFETSKFAQTAKVGNRNNESNCSGLLAADGRRHGGGRRAVTNFELGIPMIQNKKSEGIPITITYYSIKTRLLKQGL